MDNLDSYVSDLKIKGNKYIFYGTCSGQFWFRVFGYGLLIKDFRKSPPLFSDREYAKVGKPILIIGYCIIKTLKQSDYVTKTKGE